MLEQPEKEKSSDVQGRLKTTAEHHLYSYRLDIDGLRGLAVIAVILFHASKSLIPNGFRGVDIFFVISGYVVTASILRHQSKNLSEYLTSFYKRRILRLMPALLACILITTVAGGLFIRPDSFAPALDVGARALIGWSNNYLISSSSDYFGLETELNPFTHTWSLGVEEQFYFVFPIILVAIYGLRRPIQNKRLAVLALTALVVASGLFCFHLTSSDALKAYYFMPSRFWEMASGSLLFAALVAWPNFITLFKKQHWLSYATQLSAVFLIAIALTSFSPRHVSPVIGAVTATIGTLLFIAAGLNSNSILNRSVAQPAWTYLGKVSYSLYLWHWPVFVLFRWTVGMDSGIKVFLAVCIAIALALLSYYCIEQPIRKMKSLHYRRVFAIALAGILVVGTSSAAMAKTTSNGNFYLYKEYDPKDWSAVLEKIQIEDSQISRSNCVVKKDSFSPPAIKERAEVCTYPSKNPNSPHLFLIGDSHAGAALPMLSKVVEETNIGITSLFSAGCFTSLGMSRSGKQMKECPQLTHSVLAMIEEKAKANDIVLNVSRYAILNVDQGINSESSPNIIRSSNPEELISAEDAHLQIEQELTEIAKRLESKGVRLVVQAPLPEHRANADQCVPTWFSAKSGLKPVCFTEKSLILGYRQKFMNSLEAVQQQTDNLYVWDAFDALCSDRICSHFDQEKPLFSDNNHLSVHGSKSLSSNFISFLKMHKLI